MKRKVYLDGELGDKYGNELVIEADSFSDVIRCLDANFSDFRNYLEDCHEKGIGFLFEIENNSINHEEELLLAFGEGDMYIAPQPAGAKSGGAKIIAAIIIAVVVVAATGGIGSGAFSSFGNFFKAFGQVLSGTTGGTFTQIGAFMAVSLALQGFQQILLPDPSVDSPDEDESYLFQGAGQTILEGEPVPILYGELRIPGKPISFQLRTARRSFYNDAVAQQDAPIDEGDQPPTDQPPVDPRDPGDDNPGGPAPQPSPQPRVNGR